MTALLYIRRGSLPVVMSSSAKTLFMCTTTQDFVDRFSEEPKSSHETSFYHNPNPNPNHASLWRAHQVLSATSVAEVATWWLEKTGT